MTEKAVIELRNEFDAEVTNRLKKRGMNKKELSKVLGVTQQDINDAVINFSMRKKFINLRILIRDYLDMKEN